MRLPFAAAAVVLATLAGCSSATPTASTLPSATTPGADTTTRDTTPPVATPPVTTPPVTTLLDSTTPSTGPAGTNSPGDVALPRPTGPEAVGVAGTSVADAVVYFPAQPGTGSGHLPYVGKAVWASLAGLDPGLLARVVPSALVGAAPTKSGTVHPVVILLPGWRSLIAFSTSLAEDLASHGYVVIAAQTDIAAESTHSRTTAEDRAARGALFRRLLTLAATPAFAAVAGQVDASRIAIGGHSYAGAIALDVALTDRRVTAVVDIDGGARVPATRPAANRPTLLLASVDESVEPDHDLAGFAARSPDTVSVGITKALHMDLTDGALMPQFLGDSVFAPLLGAAGARGPATTATVVRRFLDATLAAAPHLPGPSALVAGLSGTTIHPYSG